MVALGLRQIRDPYYQGFAAQIAFYFMLSLIPVLILISQGMAYLFRSSIDEAVGWILQNTSGALGKQISEILYTRLTGRFTNIALVLLTFWAASRAQFSMSRIINFMFSEGRNTGRGYWSERFRALKTVGLTLIVIILCLVGMVYGGKLLIYLSHTEASWMLLRWPITLILYFVMLSYIYYVLPTEKVLYRSVIPGSAFAAVGLLVVTGLFSLYIGSVADYNILYGVFANVVAMLLWFYLMAWVLILGALLNKVWNDTNDKPFFRKDLKKEPKK